MKKNMVIHIVQIKITLKNIVNNSLIFLFHNEVSQNSLHLSSDIIIKTNFSKLMINMIVNKLVVRNRVARNIKIILMIYKNINRKIVKVH